MTDEKLLGLEEILKITGATRPQLRHWQDMGLISPPDLTRQGGRGVGREAYYRPSVVVEIRAVQRLIAKKYSLSRIVSLRGRTGNDISPSPCDESYQAMFTLMHDPAWDAKMALILIYSGVADDLVVMMPKSPEEPEKFELSWRFERADEEFARRLSIFKSAGDNIAEGLGRCLVERRQREMKKEVAELKRNVDNEANEISRQWCRTEIEDRERGLGMLGEALGKGKEERKDE